MNKADPVVTGISDVRIRCGHCRAVFDCPGDFRDLESLLRAVATGLSATCPSCGQAVRCSEKNLMWRYADGSAGGFVE